MPKRRWAATDPLDTANLKSDEEFLEQYLRRADPDTPAWVPSWVHPQTGQSFTIELFQPACLVDYELEACFDLIQQTSKEDYKNSSIGWWPDKKYKEMHHEGLRYIVVREGDDDGPICAFTSMMPTYEGGQPVLYCYEIHLEPALRGSGLGTLLMGFLDTVARNLPPITKIMLTCFVANKRGMDFYRKLGFETDEISPGPRTLRGGEVLPDYVILSKPVPQRFTSWHKQPEPKSSRARGLDSLECDRL